MTERIPIFFNHRMVADADSFSPSASKASWAVGSMVGRFGDKVEIVESGQASAMALCMAHSDKYVGSVMSCATQNGFGNKSRAVADALPYQVGSLVDACEWVASHRTRRIACSPSSGFHHARWGEGGGYCTFNGLIVAAMRLKHLGLAKRVGIIDFDFHYGDGTDEIIQRLGLTWIRHWSAGAEYTSPSQARALLSSISYGVKQFVDCDLVIYQAGADQHVDDPLGGLLTDEQMSERDRWVFRTCNMYRIPLVWNLAGGYRTDLNGTIKPVIDTHVETMRRCIEAYVDD